jgi:N-acetyl-1-D-myo-inositol-2-amino-2-deoxy-alpha-D-glucopyranoside deacetylase
MVAGVAPQLAPANASSARPGYDPAMPESGPLALMTVHAHPDDETIGTGGTMAKAVRAGHRVVLVTCTRGELGEIVVPELDTPDNHRRLAEMRAAELETALGVLGVSAWENLGYRDSGMMDDAGNQDPRSFWQADLDEAARRLTWLIRKNRPDVVTTYNAYGGYGHPDHIRTHDVTVRAFPRAGDPSWYPEQIEAGLEPWAPAKLYEQAIGASVRKAMNARLTELGADSFWLPPKDATPEEQAEFDERMAKMLVPDETITTWIDISDTIELKWEAIQKHVTQINMDFPFMKLGLDGWREFWANETYILRESRVETMFPESDLFEGIS